MKNKRPQNIAGVFTRAGAAAYCTENGREITPIGIDYNVRAGRLPSYFLGMLRVFMKDDLDNFIETSTRQGETSPEFGKTRITPTMFYEANYADEVERGELVITLDGNPVTEAYPFEANRRYYTVHYADGSREEVWSNRVLYIHTSEEVRINSENTETVNHDE